MMSYEYAYDHQLNNTLDLKGEMDWEDLEYYEHRWDLLKKGDKVWLCLSRTPITARLKKKNVLGEPEYDISYASVDYWIDNDYGFDSLQQYPMFYHCIRAKNSRKYFAMTNIIDTHYECAVEEIDRENCTVILINDEGQKLKLSKEELFCYASQYKTGYNWRGIPTF